MHSINYNQGSTSIRTVFAKVVVVNWLNVAFFSIKFRDCRQLSSQKLQTS